MPSTSATDRPLVEHVRDARPARGLALRSGRSSRSAHRRVPAAARLLGGEVGADGHDDLRRARRVVAGQATACVLGSTAVPTPARASATWRPPARRSCGRAGTPTIVAVRVWSEAVATASLLVAGAVSWLETRSASPCVAVPLSTRHRDRRRALTGRCGLRREVVCWARLLVSTRRVDVGAAAAAGDEQQRDHDRRRSRARREQQREAQRRAAAARAAPGRPAAAAPRCAPAVRTPHRAGGRLRGRRLRGRRRLRGGGVTRGGDADAAALEDAVGSRRRPPVRGGRLPGAVSSTGCAAGVGRHRARGSG